MSRAVMGRRRVEEHLARLPADVRRTFERFDAYARSRPGVVMSQLFEGRSYKIRGSLVARVDPKMNSGDGYLGVQFALEPARLRNRISGQVARFVQDRPNRPSGGHPWIFVRGEDPLLDAWLAQLFDLACEEISLLR
jgi:hypothetical protein